MPAPLAKDSEWIAARLRQSAERCADLAHRDAPPRSFSCLTVRQLQENTAGSSGEKSGLENLGTQNLVGRTIARRYQIQGRIGGGGMGDVYSARHVELGFQVAIKIMRADLAKERGFKERFYREAKAASSLQHRNSVRVLDYGQEPDGLVYLAME